MGYVYNPGTVKQPEGFPRVPRFSNFGARIANAVRASSSQACDVAPAQLRGSGGEQMPMSRDDLFQMTLRSNVRWTLEIFERVREHSGVVYVDGLDYRSDGTFDEIVIWMDSEASQRDLTAAFAAQPEVSISQTPRHS